MAYTDAADSCCLSLLFVMKLVNNTTNSWNVYRTASNSCVSIKPQVFELYIILYMYICTEFYKIARQT